MAGFLLTGGVFRKPAELPEFGEFFPALPPPERNQLDQEACRRLVNEGYGSDAAFLAWLTGRNKAAH